MQILHWAHGIEDWKPTKVLGRGERERKGGGGVKEALEPSSFKSKKKKKDTPHILYVALHPISLL